MAFMAKLKNFITQNWPPKPSFNNESIPAGSQDGRIFIVTGGNAGIGLELCKLLYKTGATIYLTARSEEKARAAIENIRASLPETTTGIGYLKCLILDLSDLQSVKNAASSFASQESKVDIIWHNAGVSGMAIKPEDRTAQGLEPFVGIHCVAPLFFTQLLLPQLKAAAADTHISFAPRVIWSITALIDTIGPSNGLDWDALEGKKFLPGPGAYTMSKAGEWLLSREFAKRYGSDGIISVATNPGNVDTDMYKEGQAAFVLFLKLTMLHKPVLAGYSLLYSGLSPDISLSTNGYYIMPWGRLRSDDSLVRKDIIKAAAPKLEGGLGYGDRFWEWCEEQFNALN